MTPHDRELLIEKMLTRASALTDSEIDEIIADEELCQLYDAALHTRAAVALKDYDAQSEWQAFSASLSPRRQRWWSASRAAAVAAVAIAIAAAAVMIFGPSADMGSAPGLVAGTDTIVETVAENADTTDALMPELPPTEAELVADADPVMPLAPKITPKRKKSHPAPQIPTEDEVKEQIMIEKARIENEIATLVAQTYIDHSYAEYMYENGGRADDFRLSDELISITAQ